jgi:hypothetical protein
MVETIRLGRTRRFGGCTSTEVSEAVGAMESGSGTMTHRIKALNGVGFVFQTKFSRSFEHVS